MFKVLITDPISDNGMNILRDNNIEIFYHPDSKLDDLKDIIKAVDGWIIRSGTKISDDLINSAVELKVIGRAGVGVDNIDINAATDRGVVVMNVPDGNTISAASISMALISALSRNIQIGHLSLLKGEWRRSELVGNELKGKC